MLKREILKDLEAYLVAFLIGGFVSFGFTQLHYAKHSITEEKCGKLCQENIDASGARCVLNVEMLRKGAKEKGYKSGKFQIVLEFDKLP